jgi:hypothetical protein
LQQRKAQNQHLNRISRSNQMKLDADGDWLTDSGNSQFTLKASDESFIG